MSLSRIIVPTPNSNVLIPPGMMPERQQRNCGTHASTVPNVKPQAGCRIQPSAHPARHSLPPCVKMCICLFLSTQKLGSRGIGLWSLRGTKDNVALIPQVLKYSILLCLDLIWILFLVLDAGFSLLLPTTKFISPNKDRALPTSPYNYLMHILQALFRPDSWPSSPL